MSVLPKLPVEIKFDPEGNPGTAPLWAIPAGRVLMLLWRPMHLCSADWFTEAIAIAKRIEQKRPSSTAGLVKCFRPLMFSGGADFTEGDVQAFCAEALPYFTGEQGVPYVGEVQCEARMSQEKK